MTVQGNTKQPSSRRSRAPLLLSSLLALVAITMLSGCASAPSVAPVLRFEPPSSEFAGLQIGRMEQWAGELAANGEVEVINPWGDVYIRHNRGGRNVGLSGAIQRLGDPAAVEQIDLRASREHVRLEVSYPEGTDLTPSGFNRPGRVDLAVLVPEGTTLRVRTRDGSITGKRIRSNIEARTESGHISLSTTGWLDTETRSGNTQLILMGERWSRAHRARSESGSIEFEFPTKAAMHVEARSAGKLSAEPEALAGYLEHSDRRLAGRWGNASESSRIDAESSTGDIRFTLYGWMRDSAAVLPPATEGRELQD